MKQLTILLDCDDTISTFMETCINKYNEIYGTNHSINEINGWYVDGIFEHGLWSIFDKTDVLQHMPIKDGALDTIKKWHDMGHKIVIVTGVTSTKAYENKIRWVKLIGLEPYIYDVIPTRHKELINGDIFIDDNPVYLQEWQEICGNANKLCLLMTAQHNKDKTYDNFIRVDNWKEIDDILNILMLVVI